MRQIVAMGGGGFLMEPKSRNPLLDDFILGLGRGAETRLCFLATASGDSDRMLVNFYTDLAPRCRGTHLALFRRTVDDIDALLLAQDVIYVGGGSTINELAVWRAHGVDRALRRAYEAGVVLAGLSAGALCWFETGVTDGLGSEAGALDVATPALGLLSGSFCPHWDGEAWRRPVYRRLIAGGMPPGYAVDDGAALHFVDGALREVVTSRPKARAIAVERDGDGLVIERALPCRFLGA